MKENGALQHMIREPGSFRASRSLAGLEYEYRSAFGFTEYEYDFFVRYSLGISEAVLVLRIR